MAKYTRKTLTLVPDAAGEAMICMRTWLNEGNIEFQYYNDDNRWECVNYTSEEEPEYVEATLDDTVIEDVIVNVRVTLQSDDETNHPTPSSSTIEIVQQVYNTNAQMRSNGEFTLTTPVKGETLDASPALLWTRRHDTDSTGNKFFACIARFRIPKPTSSDDNRTPIAFFIRIRSDGTWHTSADPVVVIRRLSTGKRDG